MKNLPTWLKWVIPIGVLAAVAIGFFAWRISVRNSIITLDQGVKQAWGNVETMYQRRADLIPNLVNTVKGYAAHESNTLEAVTAARTGLKQAYDAAVEANNSAQQAPPADLQAYQQTQSDLNRQLGIYINAVHEAYPDLKANTNFIDLQTQLEGTENRIAVERTRYNEAVRAYNERILRFPGSMFASGFSERQMFNADPGASKAPTVDFGNGSSSPSVDF